MTEAAPLHTVETEALTKIYPARGSEGARRALDAVSLSVPRGSFFGLLGPNGAGKSTLINILAGLVIKTSGTARVWGHDVEKDARRARSAIGVVPQELNLDPFFTPRELLETQAGLYGVPPSERQTNRILERVGLSDKANAYARTLSGGMRRRLLVAKAMVHSPPVLILDEPTAGVDVELRRNLWEMLSEMNESGTTIVLTTHYLEEAERLCDRIAIIDHGRLVACDDKNALLRRFDSKVLTVTLDRELYETPAALAGFETELKDRRSLIIRYQPSKTDPGKILAAIRESGLVINDLTTEEADLEDIFLGLIRRSA